MCEIPKSHFTWMPSNFVQGERGKGGGEMRTKMCIQQIASFSKYLTFGWLCGAWKENSFSPAEAHCSVWTCLINIGLGSHVWILFFNKTHCYSRVCNLTAVSQNTFGAFFLKYCDRPRSIMAFATKVQFSSDLARTHLTRLNTNTNLKCSLYPSW